MKLVLDLSDIAELDRPIAGGKALALAKMVPGLGERKFLKNFAGTFVNLLSPAAYNSRSSAP